MIGSDPHQATLQKKFSTLEISTEENGSEIPTKTDDLEVLENENLMEFKLWEKMELPSQISSEPELLRNVFGEFEKYRGWLARLCSAPPII